MAILVVEDEIKIANLVKKVVEMDHHVVELAHDGKDGLLKAEKNNYDLIILDIMLPGLNGMEVCRILRNKKIKTPIIMLTARDTIEDRLAAMDAGADDYLSKPFAFEDLLVRIETMLVRNKNGNKTTYDTGSDKYQQEKTDTTEHVCDEEKFAEINKRIMDNAPVSVITIDKEGYITSANRYFQKFSRTKDYHDQNIFNNEFFIRENLVDDYRKLLTQGITVRKENCYEKNSKGEDKYLKIIAVPLRDKEGNIDGAISMAIDNTDTVLFKNELQKLNDELEKNVTERTTQLKEVNKELARVLKLKSMFMADVSHEMRTSLAIIQGNTEMFFRGLTSGQAEREETYGQIFGEIKRMSTMLSDLMLLSDSESSKHNLDYKRIDLNELISAVCKSLRVVAEEKNIDIKHENSKAVVEIMADSMQLEKMLMNLVRNAIRYNKKNGWIRIWVEKKEDEIILSVKDGGIGIAEENLPYIFERFYRVDKARSRNAGGSGLGLAICKWIAQIHGGKIEVRSTVGEGSLFSVTLPQTQEN